MSAITVQVSEELAERLRNVQERLPEILELGLRELNSAASPGFEGASEILEFLASLPAPEEILALQPSERLDRRVRELLAKSRTQGLTASEEGEWERYQYLEHLVRVAKTRAKLRLGVADGG